MGKIKMDTLNLNLSSTIHCMDMIRNATLADTAVIAEIYNHYVLRDIATFEEEPVEAAEMARRMGEVAAKFPWTVHEVDGRVLGYAYANTWKARAAYRHSVETTIYLHPDAVGRGIGYPLYMELLGRLQTMGFHAVMGGISLPNEASVRLHEKCGYKKVGEFKEVGFKFGKWIDVGYWQRILI